jgi:hypothetical protein
MKPTNEELVGFFALLLEVDQRVNPHLYTPPSVGGSDSRQDGKDIA